MERLEHWISSTLVALASGSRSSVGEIDCSICDVEFSPSRRARRAPHSVTISRQDIRAEPIGLGEFVGLMATLTALVAASIDMILPALPAIGSALGADRANQNQLVISFLFFGFGLGQLVYGPLSDNTGRKPAVYVGLGFFISGCLLALLSQTYSMMLTGRFLQGLGVAGPRAVTIALVRDKFEGRSMARVMSLIMTVFILVPVVAPTLGQAVLSVSGWRTIFGIYLTMAIVACVWFGLRQEETLPVDRRIPFSLARIIGAFREVLASRTAFGCTIAAGLVFGAFMGYLNSAQQILQQLYDLGPRFPQYFAALAIAIGTASFLNAHLVMRHGMQRLSAWSLRTICSLSIVFLGIAVAQSGHPPLWTFMLYMMLSFLCIGLLFSNLNAMAMQPLGHIAGTGAAVVGALSTLTSLVLGTLIGQSYNETILPLVSGFAILSILAMLTLRWAESAERAPGDADLAQRKA
jgi:DHA1 family bicyclomycin/chloramphenicol resistance-like MFS transporter